MQLDKGYRGFSFSKEGALDMRMDSTSKVTAEEIVNEWSESALGELFREYGEDPRWKRAAKAIVEARKKKRLTTTSQLADVVSSALQTKTRGKLHPATLVFQAIRMCVNREIESLTEGIVKAIERLNSKGRIGVISFHSIEDRIVKSIFKSGATVPAAARKKEGLTPVLKLLTKKPWVPSLSECRLNPRARSAKMRFAEKI